MSQENTQIKDFDIEPNYKVVTNQYLYIKHCFPAILINYFNARS